MDHANSVLGEMVEEGMFTAEERAQMVVGSYPRRKRELLAPFGPSGKFRELVVEEFDSFVLPDEAWSDFQRDGDAEVLATKHAQFFRSIFAPSLASALARAGDPDEHRVFGDRLAQGLTRRLASQPRALHSLVQTIVLAKQGSSS
jgi:hypothetical protein